MSYVVKLGSLPPTATTDMPGASGSLLWLMLAGLSGFAGLALTIGRRANRRS